MMQHVSPGLVNTIPKIRFQRFSENFTSKLNEGTTSISDAIVLTENYQASGYFNAGSTNTELQTKRPLQGRII